jgi:hypothetical protein
VKPRRQPLGLFPDTFGCWLSWVRTSPSRCRIHAGLLDLETLRRIGCKVSAELQLFVVVSRGAFAATAHAARAVGNRLIINTAPGRV